MDGERWLEFALTHAQRNPAMFPEDVDLVNFGPLFISMGGSTDILTIDEVVFCPEFPLLLAAFSQFYFPEFCLNPLRLNSGIARPSR